jgi:hypothetical protein
VLAGGLACVLVTGCFGPEPRDGLRCTGGGDCPPGQECYPVAGGPAPGVCASAPPGDGGVGGDAGPGSLFGAPEMVVLQCGTDAPAPCASPRDPSLTGDLTQIAFTVESVNAAGDRDVYLARRGTPDEAWGTAAPAGAIDTLYVEEGVWMAGDGLLLYFTRDDQNVGGAPYGDLWVSSRVAPSDPFDGTGPVAGVVNTAHGDERGAAQAQGGTWLVFARALDAAPDDHDVYLALAGGGQWDTVARIPALAVAGTDERAAALVEATRSLFVARGDRIVEARWTGDDVASAEVVAVHDELAVEGATAISGVWLSPDGGEIWFAACGATCALYRAVR